MYHLPVYTDIHICIDTNTHKQSKELNETNNYKRSKSEMERLLHPKVITIRRQASLPSDSFDAENETRKVLRAAAEFCLIRAKGPLIYEKCPE